MRPDLPPEWRAKLQEERRQSLRAGRYGSFESRSERGSITPFLLTSQVPN
jgi:hypothetical protein